MTTLNLSFGGGSSVILKLLFIAVLSILLLIPASWVDGLIRERDGRKQEVIDDLSDKWSGSQLIQGPVLVIPYKKLNHYKDSEGREVIKEAADRIYLLPEQLRINAKVNTQHLSRSIYKVGVYNSLVHLNGHFNKADLNSLQIDSSLIAFDKARLLFSISDLKGLKSNPAVLVNNQHLNAEPSLNSESKLDNGLQVPVNLASMPGRQINYSFDLDLKGSQEMKFLHLGKTTEVKMKGNWPSPSFDGRYLPDNRHITEKSFDAQWHMLYYNRPFPQQWVSNDTLLNSLKNSNNSVFGVKLYVQVDDYQKIMRTTKYAILIIMLTFVSLFLTELIQQQRIHIFNYALIGAAMIVFYTLLLSFSERIGYNWAYLIAAVSTVALIAWFTGALLENKKAASLFAVILSLFYTFIFVIIQLEDMALLVGSIALFVIVALLMYFSKKITWEQQPAVEVTV